MLHFLFWFKIWKPKLITIFSSSFSLASRTQKEFSYFYLCSFLFLKTWTLSLWQQVCSAQCSLSLSCFPLLRSLAESYLWRKGTSKKMFVQKNRRVKVPRLKAEFTRNEDMCNNFQIVLTDTIFFYWLETVFSKRDHAREIRGDKKLKQCIDGSFLTAKNEKAVPSQGK